MYAHIAWIGPSTTCYDTKFIFTGSSWVGQVRGQLWVEQNNRAPHKAADMRVNFGKHWQSRQKPGRRQPSQARWGDEDTMCSTEKKGRSMQDVGTEPVTDNSRREWAMLVYHHTLVRIISSIIRQQYSTYKAHFTGLINERISKGWPRTTPQEAVRSHSITTDI